ncbi:hypothetical protein NM688_g7763 [Phlebia brevispora]|uniref:Uncharacterized protein n=1 Tax=Phlebia brevispora TaxID=194682 RepID=A0ACC1S1D0_9APHY|nr:hypothetical protein NM688_g7763 [Phlebia brevispora]
MLLYPPNASIDARAFAIQSCTSASILCIVPGDTVSLLLSTSGDVMGKVKEKDSVVVECDEEERAYEVSECTSGLQGKQE